MSDSRLSVTQVRAAFASASQKELRTLIVQYAEDPRSQVQQIRAIALARCAAEASERKRLRRLYALENDLRREGFAVVAGVDEVGRGALAGPLTSAAVVLPERPHIQGLDDSKKLTPLKRTEVARRVFDIAVCTSIAHVFPEEIDSVGMGAALRLAMSRALAGLALSPDHVVIDGLPVGVAPGETAVVGGDAKVAAIAAASVIAKVTRDTLMVELQQSVPGYGFAENKGYSTADHLAAIDRFGPSHVHRRSFAPCGGTLRLFRIDTLASPADADAADPSAPVPPPLELAPE
jgi:ribonuclease HII